MRVVKLKKKNSEKNDKIYKVHLKKVFFDGDTCLMQLHSSTSFQVQRDTEANGAGKASDTISFCLIFPLNGWFRFRTHGSI